MTQAKLTDRAITNALVCAGCNEFSVWGPPKATIQQCLTEVSEILGCEIESSSLYETPAFPKGSGPNFVNAAFRFQTDLCANEVLKKLSEIEQKALRKRDTRWGPRTLDLDLIGLGDEIWPNVEIWHEWATLPLAEQQRLAPDELILPHPRAQDRAFVLVPLAEIAPDWVHPVYNRTIKELCDGLDEALKHEFVRLK